jgi:hypothetical protein
MNVCVTNSETMETLKDPIQKTRTGHKNKINSMYCQKALERQTPTWFATQHDVTQVAKR